MEELSYQVTALERGGWRIEDDIVCMYLFEGTQRALLVDTGVSGGALEQTVRRLTSKPVTLVNTHADWDHISCNGQFPAAYLHPAEFAYYRKMQPEAKQVFPLWEGDCIDLGGRRFEVIHLPGHTPGSIALLDRANKVLVAGDSVSETPVFLFEEGKDLRAYLASMEKLCTCLGEIEQVYPSHGPRCPIEAEQITRMRDGARQVLAGAATGQTPPMDVPAKLYAAAGALFLY